MFDTSTRNKLASFVGKARKLLCGDYNKPGGEITSLLQTFGIQPDGAIADLESVPGLDQTGYELGHTLRDILAHKHAQSHDKKTWGKYDAAVYDLLQEQSFTILNRLCALRMAEERGIILPCVSQGMDSDGFVLYDGNQKDVKGITDKSHFDRDTRYQHFLFSMFDELAIDLGTLFDRSSPHSLLFPRPEALGALLDLLNDRELACLWAQDETIGWIYQYWNSKEERKAMRDASAAPRNSRELAVRNQFFTPRYVVEFLTDNTLGRIWYEMTQGETALKEQCRYLVRRPTEIFLQPGQAAPNDSDNSESKIQNPKSQEELLLEPVHIPHRPLKDPREIRLLDPACGSMHFGLYAFDLFETIYEEALNNGSCPALQEAYASKEEFLKDVPRLIIEHNIHGIDIDPRAVQIAGLSLWLRAQKAWQQRKVPAADRPRVRRSNIVCAEPMPGSPEMLEDFVATLKPDLLGELVKTVFDKMQLAGEAGSLLKIEEEIRTAIDTARKEWLKQQDDLLTRKDGSQKEFFNTAEQQVIDALRAYAEQADADSYQRRLFADDAARGFAFIDLCRKRYDAVVMNPPFGEPAEATRNLFKQIYPTSADNVAVAFMERGEQLLVQTGLTSSITDCSWAKKYDYRGFRELVLAQAGLYALVHLGWEVLDNANVETNLTVRGMGSQFAFTLNVSNVDDKGGDIARSASNESSQSFFPIHRFSQLPNSVFAFEMRFEEFDAYAAGSFVSGSFMTAVAGVKSCNSTADFRAWWEVPHLQLGSKCDWQLLHNGSPYCPFHYPAFFAVRADGGKWTQLMANGGARPGEAYYERPGVAYGKRTDSMYGYVKPKEQVFSQEGQAIFPSDEVPIWAALALANAAIYSRHANYVAGQHKYHNYLNKICLPASELPFTAVENAKSAFEGLRAIDQANENTHLFACPTISKEFDLGRSAADRSSLAKNRIHEVLRLQAANNEIISKSFRLSIDEREVRDVDYYNHYFGIPFSPQLVGCTWISYTVGTAFGRWDIRYATGERQPPELPDPFDPLPVCPPGMLQNVEGLPAQPKDAPPNYPLRISWPGILVDDENHPEDIVARVREAIEVIWKDRAEAIEQEACDILGVKALRDYFRRPAAFFADHLKRYSKSRRQAPIYWPLSTKTGSYTLWLYYHRLSNDTLYAAVTQFVEPRIEEAKRAHARLHEKGDARSKLEDKTYEETTQLIGELATFREELLRIAGFWKPNLNDGVLITAAPLWSLFALNTWQKKLKETWQDLEKGKYDWAHLAYSIWPERVAKGCEKDRSIAIAHGLEHLCKVEPPKAKKKAKGKAVVVEDEVDSELIGED